MTRGSKLLSVFEIVSKDKGSFSENGKRAVSNVTFLLKWNVDCFLIWLNYKTINKLLIVSFLENPLPVYAPMKQCNIICKVVG